MLIEPLRHVANPRFSTVIFRRTYPEITNEGGLWEESSLIYPLAGAKPKVTDLKWVFPSKATVRFAHMQHESDKHNWQGAQIPLIEFDELTHFDESQFFYLFSRSRSMSGVKPYIRAACNPDALSWVKRFLAPWVDKASPLKAASGELLWMVREGGVFHWHRSFTEAAAAHAYLWTPDIRPENVVKSVTFVSARIHDNKMLLAKDPGYLGNLMALPPVERERLLNGDWDIVPAAGKVLDRAWFEVVGSAPEGRTDPVPYTLDGEEAARAARDRQWDVRFWDFAASVRTMRGDDPDFTAGVKLRRVRGSYHVVDVVHGRWTPGDLDRVVRNTASQDGKHCAVRWEEEGGASGKVASRHLLEVLDGYDARAVRPQGDKVTRAQPFAAQAEGGAVKVVRAGWNEAYLTELHHFPDAAHDDQVDATSGAYAFLSQYAADVTVGPDIWSQ